MSRAADRAAKARRAEPPRYTVAARVHLRIGDEVVPTVVQVGRGILAFEPERCETLCAVKAARKLIAFLPLLPPGYDDVQPLEAWEGRGEE